MRRLALYATLAVALFSIGCGKKGPPTLPPPPTAIKMVNVEGVYEPGVGVRLLWDTNAVSGDLLGFDISRGEEQAGVSKCRACDDFYRKVAFLSPQEAASFPDSLQTATPRQFGFLDQDIHKNYAYFYRIRPTYKNGSAGEWMGVTVETSQ